MTAGYVDLGSQTLYFESDADWHYDSDEAVDVGLTYVRSIGSNELQVGVQIFNVKNSRARVTFNRDITPDETGPRDELGRPLRYIEGPNFGQTTSQGDYQRPREYKFSMALLF